MAHEHRLTVYKIELNPANLEVENSNRNLFRHIIGQANQTELDDHVIFLDVFAAFIKALDTEKMFVDPKTKKCMTANQRNLGNADVKPNIEPLFERFIIHGKIEGGGFGRRRKKTSTENKAQKSDISEQDAITDDFYFLIYMPPGSNKSVLMLHSYSDDKIDSVVRVFWKNFLKSENVFDEPQIDRFVPAAIIDKFKSNATVSNITYSTEVPSDTLFKRKKNRKEMHFKVTVSITPIGEEIKQDEFDDTVRQLDQAQFTSKMKLGQFFRKKGKLRNIDTRNNSPFDIGTSFEIQPVILLEKYIDVKGDESDLEKIKHYCLGLLDSIIPEIYRSNAIQER